MMIAIFALCAVVGTYLYVMGLCYLCDLYEMKRQKKQEEEEKRRKEKLHQALDEAEKKRKAEARRRALMARTPKQQRVRHPLRNPATVRPVRAANG
jgi:hypothetical protein